MTQRYFFIYFFFIENSPSCKYKSIEYICLFFSLSFSFNIQRNLGVDYDPKNISHHQRYLCLENRKEFKPNLENEPILREYTIPFEYSVKQLKLN